MKGLKLWGKLGEIYGKSMVRVKTMGKRWEVLGKYLDFWVTWDKLIGKRWENNMENRFSALVFVESDMPQLGFCFLLRVRNLNLSTGIYIWKVTKFPLKMAID